MLTWPHAYGLQPGADTVTPKRQGEAADSSADEHIVAGLLAGQPWAADQLYRRVHRAMLRVLHRTLRYKDPEIEDLMQESFERMLRVLSERPLPGACNLPAWAAAVTSNIALDRLRRRAREQRLLDHASDPAEAPMHGPAPERGLEARHRLARVQQTLARMRPHYAEALVLHDVLGYDLLEIAQLTGTTAAAAQSRLVRGRREFQRRIGPRAKS